MAVASEAERLVELERCRTRLELGIAGWCDKESRARVSEFARLDVEIEENRQVLFREEYHSPSLVG
jgi:hypothetical protein